MEYEYVDVSKIPTVGKVLPAMDVDGVSAISSAEDIAYLSEGLIERHVAINGVVPSDSHLTGDFLHPTVVHGFDSWSRLVDNYSTRNPAKGRSIKEGYVFESRHRRTTDAWTFSEAYSDAFENAWIDVPKLKVLRIEDFRKMFWNLKNMSRIYDYSLKYNCTHESGNRYTLNKETGETSTYEVAAGYGWDVSGYSSSRYLCTDGPAYTTWSDCVLKINRNVDSVVPVDSMDALADLRIQPSSGDPIHAFVVLSVSSSGKVDGLSIDDIRSFLNGIGVDPSGGFFVNSSVVNVVERFSFRTDVSGVYPEWQWSPS